MARRKKPRRDLHTLSQPHSATQQGHARDHQPDIGVLSGQLAPSPQTIARLQRTVGNQTVARMLAQRQASLLQREDSDEESQDDDLRVTTTSETALKELPDEHTTMNDTFYKKLGDLDKKKGAKAIKHKQRHYDRKPITRWARPFRAALRAAGLSSNPIRTSTILAAKFPKGPLITTEQFAALKAVDDAGTLASAMWFSRAGMFTLTQATTYLEAHKFQDWLMLSPSNRVLLAYMAWRKRSDFGDENVRGTPPYNLGRSMDSKDDDIKSRRRRRYKRQIDKDIREMWVKTLGITGLNDEAKQGIEQGGARSHKKKKTLTEDKVARNHGTATEVLKKILLLLHSGLQTYDKDAQAYQDYSGSVSRALSHGGRVTVRIPALQSGNEDAYALTRWLGVTTRKGKRKRRRGIFERDFGTHHQAIGKNKPDGTKGKFREQGGAGAAMNSKFGDTLLLGLNLSVGGLGQRDFNGDIILPDGAHGHLLLIFRPPSVDRDGALQIGIETTGPHAKSTVGYKHTAKSSEATANPESSFGGLKSDKVGEGSAATLKWYGRYKDSDERNRTDEETNARLVDLTSMGNDWMDRLTALEGDFNELTQTLRQNNREIEALEALVGGKQKLQDLIQEVKHGDGDG